MGVGRGKMKTDQNELQPRHRRRERVSSWRRTTGRRRSHDFLPFLSFSVEDHLNSRKEGRKDESESVREVGSVIFMDGKGRGAWVRRRKGPADRKLTSSSLLIFSEAARELARVLPWTEGVDSWSGGEVWEDMKENEKWVVDRGQREKGGSEEVIFKGFGRDCSTPKTT